MPATPITPISSVKPETPETPSKKEIYLDNSATTMPSREAIDAARRASEDIWGNPSSIHRAGQRAAELLLSSRNEILKALLGEKITPRLPRYPGFRAGEGVGKLIFTSGGTESDDLAIFGILSDCKVKRPRVVTTSSEHPAVLSTLELLENKGVEVVRLSTVRGVIDTDEFLSALTPETVLVTIMYVNNETGAIYDLPTLFALAKEKVPGVVCHSDCVQAFGKLPFTPASLKADMITISAHKVHGLKGTGALWVSDALARKLLPRPHIIGGGQEDNYRSGTENIPGIYAFAEAVRANGSDKAHIEFTEKTEHLRSILLGALPDGVRLNEPAGRHVPHILSLTIPKAKSQPVLNFLSREGICVSSGSACSSHKDTVSHVLTAFGLSHDDADRTIRVSLDPMNTEEEMIRFCETLDKCLKKLGK